MHQTPTKRPVTLAIPAGQRAAPTWKNKNLVANQVIGYSISSLGPRLSLRQLPSSPAPLEKGAMASLPSSLPPTEGILKVY